MEIIDELEPVKRGIYGARRWLSILERQYGHSNCHSHRSD